MSRRHTHTTRSRDRPSSERTLSLSLSPSERGQTTQDFAVGIGIFLLTIAFVFSYVPTLATPYESTVGGAETAQADRIADRIVENTSDSTTPNELDGSLYQGNFTDDNLTAAVGLRASDDVIFDRVNVGIKPLGEDEPTADWSGGHTYDNQTAASSARIVTVDDSDVESSIDDIDCDPACRLIVRVW